MDSGSHQGFASWTQKRVWAALPRQPCFCKRSAGGFCVPGHRGGGTNLPERYGKYKSVHKRFVRCAAQRGSGSGSSRSWCGTARNQYLMIDSTIVAGTPASGHGRKKGARTRLWGLPRRSDHQRFTCSATNSASRWQFLLNGGQVNRLHPGRLLLGERKAERCWPTRVRLRRYRRAYRSHGEPRRSSAQVQPQTKQRLYDKNFISNVTA